MPFKSEKQRRYLWANEPEIAKDWTDTYGSKIHAAEGGIMRLPFAEGSGEVIVDNEGLIYEESPLSNNYTEEEFNEVFAKPEESNFKIKMPSLNFFSGLYNIANKSVPWGWARSALNFMGENNPMNFLNVNRPTPQQQQATQNYMNQYNVSRNPQTGRMMGGLFSGQNAPGTSMFGSQTPQQMAQNWMSKYGSMNYNTERQMAKQKEIRDLAAGNTNVPPTERTFTPTGGGHSGQPTGGHHEGGGGGIGSTASSQGPAGGSVGASRFRSRGGRLYNTGGLAGLWPR